MGNRKRYLIVVLSLIYMAFAGVFSLLSGTSQGKDQYKESPIFKNRLNTTLKAWERQGKVIKPSKVKNLEDPSIKKEKEIIRGLFNKIQEEPPPPRTQDSNSPGCVRGETRYPDDLRCIETIDPKDLNCRETLDPENPICAETLDPNDPDCDNITRDPDDPRCFTLDPSLKECRRFVTKDPRDVECKVSLDPEGPLCKETLDPDNSECRETLDPAAGCNPTREPNDDRCEKTFDPDDRDCMETFDPNDPRCVPTLDPNDPKCIDSGSTIS